MGIILFHAPFFTFAIHLHSTGHKVCGYVHIPCSTRAQNAPLYLYTLHD